MHRKLDPAECGLSGFRGRVRRADSIDEGLMQQNYRSGLSRLHMPLPFPTA